MNNNNTLMFLLIVIIFVLIFLNLTHRKDSSLTRIDFGFKQLRKKTLKHLLMGLCGHIIHVCQFMRPDCIIRVHKPKWPHMIVWP